MTPFSSIQNHPASHSLPADSILESHTARVLLLLEIVGIEGCIKGLFRFAKLDFLVRHPDIFWAIMEKAKYPEALVDYAPWDTRYSAVFDDLRSKGLLRTDLNEDGAWIYLTKEGRSVARDLMSRLEAEVDWDQSEEISMMENVRDAVGNLSAEELKRMIYNLWDR